MVRPHFDNTNDLLKNTIESIKNQNVEFINFIYDGSLETYINERKKQPSNKLIEFIKNLVLTKYPIILKIFLSFWCFIKLFFDWIYIF